MIVYVYIYLYTFIYMYRYVFIYIYIPADAKIGAGGEEKRPLHFRDAGWLPHDRRAPIPHLPKVNC